MLEFKISLKRKKIIPNYIDYILNDECILGGGAARSIFTKEKINDYDLFPNSFKKMEEIKSYFLSLGATIKFECPEKKLISLMYKNEKIQLIKTQEYNNVYELLDSFDFTCTQFAYFNNILYVYKSDCLSDAKRKHLILHKLTYPAATIKRINKYVNYGYKTYPSLYSNIAKLIYDRTNTIKDSALVYID
jgi:hypothetical protein